MRNVHIETINPYDGVDLNQDIPIPEITKEEYEQRIRLLVEKMEQDGMTYCLVFADREHFANMQYLTGFEPRFEESLLIVSHEGKLTLLVGNECMAYSKISPLPLRHVLYQNFSLQGQPREKLVSLCEIFQDAGINHLSKVGIIGHKYFEKEHIGAHLHKVDIPAYILEELLKITEWQNVINYTDRMIHPTEGIRMKLRTATEIAYYEAVSHRASNGIIRLLKELKPGLGELEASRLVGYDAFPISMFPIVNFGEKHVQLGLRSPNNRKLKKGEMITICYGLRGCLIARSGFAALTKNDVDSFIENFYKPYFLAIVDWYESLAIGRMYGETFNKVMGILGDSEKFGIYLNPGHLISLDEWPHSPVYEDSNIPMVSGHYLQCDIIASTQNPFCQAILEDGVILADEALREQLRLKFPETYSRIHRRRRFMIETLGIRISEDVLPLSNCQAILHPYLLDQSQCFVIRN
ncbi:aminopeptidase P family N-terminal domain-containing protein [Neobacillus drentensis]|uniref:aminopeptidase P family N-terminal domain-containing protein n=1 Tax=Neobacillus drentensis TaxID=220684 RepID=UPI002FFFC702